MATDEPVFEASIALALRDSQWIAEGADGLPMVSPRSYIALTADPEAALGDALFPMGERYFIFEFKASRSRIKSEWRLRDIDGNQKPAKGAHRTLHALMSAWNPSTSNSPHFAQITQSMLGHFFVYGDEKEIRQDLPQSGLVAESYLRATASLVGTSQWSSWLELLDDRFRFAVPIGQHQPGQNGWYEATDRFDIATINADQGALLYFAGGTSSPPFMAYQLGLPPNIFQQYVDTLVRGSGIGGGEIRAMVTNVDGTFARLVTHTNDLKALFSPAPGPSLTPQRTRPPGRQTFNFTAPVQQAAIPRRRRTMDRP